MTGKLKIALVTKGYGFIRGDEDKVEYFFHREDFIGHWNDLCADAEERERNTIPMQFTLVDSPKGPRASNVSRLDFPNGVDNAQGQEDIRNTRGTSKIADSGGRRFQKPRGLR